MRKQDPARVNAALQILSEAVRLHPDDPIATPPVQLALRELYPFLHDHRHLTQFWEDAERADVVSLSSRRGNYSAIAMRLVTLGIDVNPQLR